MNKYYIKFGISQNFNAGSKAMKDIMFLLESQGYAPIMSLRKNTQDIGQHICEGKFFLEALRNL